MDSTYIKIEVRGNLNDNELKGLGAFLQDAADQIVLAVVTDFDKTIPEDEL